MKRFINLNDVGLQNMAMDDLFKPNLARNSQCLGIRQFSDTLPCDRIIYLPLGAQRMDKSLLNRNRGLVFSHLLNALSQCDGLKIQKLYTRRLGLTPEHLVMTKSQYEGLMPHLRGLEYLQLRLRNVRSYPEGARSQFEALLSLLVTVVPGLKVLDFSQPAQEQSTKSLRMNSEVFSQRVSCISFLRLESLHLCHFDITTDALMTFIHSAAPTLKVMVLNTVSLNDEISSITQDENTISEDIIRSAESNEAVLRLWQQVFDFFGEQLGLQYLRMESLKYRHSHEIQIKDPSDPIYTRTKVCFGTSRSPPRAPSPTLDSDISFHEWINQLQIIPESRRDTTGERIPISIEL